MLPESLRCQKTRYLMTLEILVWGHEDFKHIIVCMCFGFFFIETICFKYSHVRNDSAPHFLFVKLKRKFQKIISVQIYLQYRKLRTKDISYLSNFMNAIYGNHIIN